MSLPQPDTTNVDPGQNAWPLGPLYFIPVSTVTTRIQPTEPIVTVYPTGDKDTYHLCVFVYIPEGAYPSLDKNFSDIKIEKTQAGKIPTRMFKVSYENTHQPTYMLWILEVDYQVEGLQADAICVYYSMGDPNTSRGTVTTVSNS